MKIQIQKWGNSLALRIPKAFAIETNVEQGSTVDVSLEEGRIVVIPVAEPEYPLDNPLARISEKNIHGEIDTGERVGRETW